MSRSARRTRARSSCTTKIMARAAGRRDPWLPVQWPWLGSAGPGAAGGWSPGDHLRPARGSAGPASRPPDMTTALSPPTCTRSCSQRCLPPWALMAGFSRSFMGSSVRARTTRRAGGHHHNLRLHVRDRNSSPFHVSGLCPCHGGWSWHPRLRAGRPLAPVENPGRCPGLRSGPPGGGPPGGGPPGGGVTGAEDGNGARDRRLGREIVPARSPGVPWGRGGKLPARGGDDRCQRVSFLRRVASRPGPQHQA